MRTILTKDEVEEIKNFIKHSVYPLGCDKHQRKTFAKKANRFFIEDDKLYLQDGNNILEVIPRDDVEQLLKILSDLHLPAHRGVKTMYMAVKRRFVGFKREQIDLYVKSCDNCQRTKPLKRISQITPIISDAPWDHIQSDLVDLRNYAGENDGYCWILTIIDTYSKFGFTFALKDKTAETVRNIFKRLFYAEGAPRKLQTDNGKEFSNALIKELCRSLGILLIHGRPRHPQSQGQVERFNQTIVWSLTKALGSTEQKKWIELLDEITFSYNLSWHRAINTMPMEVFRRRPGRYHNVFVSQDEPEQEQIEENVYFAGNLNRVVDVEINNIEVVELDKAQELEDGSAIMIRETHFGIDMYEYQFNYIKKMTEDADVHSFKIDNFHIGDQVIIAKDFDNNPATRHKKLEGFYEEGCWKIIRKINHQTFEVEFENHKRIVCKQQLKKI